MSEDKGQGAGNTGSEPQKADPPKPEPQKAEPPKSDERIERRIELNDDPPKTLLGVADDPKTFGIDG